MKNTNYKPKMAFLKNQLCVKKEINTRGTNAIQSASIDFNKEPKPENELELALLQSEAFTTGLLWGVPRYGHPEGQIYRHIKEVFENIEKLQISPEDRSRLRLITLVHDTFKYKEHKGFPRNWSKHHSILARQFLEPFCNDQVVLDIVELHDEAYYSWRFTHLYHQPKKGAKRLRNLLDRLGNNLQLYYLFFKCDTQTGDKTQAPVHWFEEYIEGIEIVHF